MAFSGATHNRIHDFTDDEDNSIDPSAQRFDEEFDDVSSSLETRLAKDGTNSATANIPMGGFKLTGLATGSLTSTDSAAIADVFKAYPPGHIDGLGVSIGTDTDHDVSIAAGTCRAEGADFNFKTTASITDKEINTSWVAGSGNGGWPSAGVTLTANNRYRVFLIADSSGTIDAGFDDDPAAANLLATSSYTYYRQVGWIFIDDNTDLSIALDVSHPAASEQLISGIDLSTFTTPPANFDFRDDIDATYKRYRVTWDGVIISADADLRLRTSTNGGSSFDSGASDYTTGGWRASGSGNTGIGGVAAFVTMGGSAGVMDADAAHAIHGEMILSDPAGTTNTVMDWTLFFEGTGGDFVKVTGGAKRDSAADVDAIQFLLDTGSFSAGVFKLYGIK